MERSLDLNADPVAQAKGSWMRALKQSAFIDRHPTLTFPALIDAWGEARGATLALSAPDGALTYGELALRCHRYARWGLRQGLKSGDTVALLLPNCAEYLAAWLGLTRLGVAVALQNTHLSGAVLAHAVNVVRPRLAIVGATLAATLHDARPHLPDLDTWVLGAAGGDWDSLDAALAAESAAALSAAECPLPSIDATALYIYTSGTTGHPKAARVSHYRLMQWSHWFAGLMDTGPGDIMYDCLPLYHSVGGVVATGATLVGGGMVAIRPRFSASDFWRDVKESGATLFQYIGELCRYLVNAPVQPAEHEHGLRIACGNGLKAEVWNAFQARFRIPRILEYYAATEANFSLYNAEGEPGAIGRIPAYLKSAAAVALLKFDVDAGEPWRNAAGRCEACGVDEVGEAVGRIPASSERAGRFEGYAGDDSGRKVLRDVFAAGDAWYRTGDLMRRDARGFYYFVDRVGETFRWKGENVSTAQVLSVLSGVPGVLEGVVYGVAIPGTDGRAGMAALQVAPDFDLHHFHAAVSSRLPAYARPMFLRLVAQLDATATFKPVKHELMKAGFDPHQVSDPLYFADATRAAYVPLDAALHARIVSGGLRL